MDPTNISISILPTIDYLYKLSESWNNRTWETLTTQLWNCQTQSIKMHVSNLEPFTHGKNSHPRCIYMLTTQTRVFHTTNVKPYDPIQGYVDSSIQSLHTCKKVHTPGVKQSNPIHKNADFSIRSCSYHWKYPHPWCENIISNLRKCRVFIPNAFTPVEIFTPQMWNHRTESMKMVTCQSRSVHMCEKISTQCETVRPNHWKCRLLNQELFTSV